MRMREASEMHSVRYWIKGRARPKGLWDNVLGAHGECIEMWDTTPDSHHHLSQDSPFTFYGALVISCTGNSESKIAFLDGTQRDDLTSRGI